MTLMVLVRIFFKLHSELLHETLRRGMYIIYTYYTL